MGTRVLAAMSGGVDSSVAALLLLREGCDVVGVTLRLFSNEDLGQEDGVRPCCSLADVQDARDVCDLLGIDHHVFNFRQRFETEVITRFVDGYLRGETPNPCIDCNRFIKFGPLLDRARLMGADYLATGHYARVERDSSSGRFLLKKGVDETKDQSYFLYAMTQDQLAAIRFPLGGLHKPQVRVLAAEAGFVNSKKSDSQDICFVPDGDYAAFLEEVRGVPPTPGDIVDTDKQVLRQHNGIHRYTIGQRKGLGISAGHPLYVVSKDPVSQHVVVGSDRDLYSSVLIARDVNLIAIDRIDVFVRAMVKTRYRQREVPATLSPLENSRIRISFDEPQRALTPGQAVVFYQGEAVLGGGTIDRELEYPA